MHPEPITLKNDRVTFDLGGLEPGESKTLGDNYAMIRSSDGLTYNYRVGHDIYMLDPKDFGMGDGTDSGS